MSLRLRLLFTIGIALTLLWGASAAWMWRDVTHDLQRMLDQRLAMSAQMVAGLLSRRLAFEAGSDQSVVDRLVTVPAGQGMACQIRSMRGEIIAATHGAPASLSAAVTPGYHTRTIDGTAWRTYTLQANGLSITTADRVSGRQMLRQQIALAAGLPFLIAAIGGLLALWLGTTRGLRPLRRLRRDLSRRGPDALDPLTIEHLPRELRPLVETLNRFLHRTHQAMQRERHFTNDAAHELRTPLTAISTHLQVARMTSGTAAETALADAETGVERMRSTLEQLLLLARVEGRLPFEEKRVIDAATVLDSAIADSGAAAAERVVRQVEDGTVMVNVASSLAVVALRNLIDNALRYSPDDAPFTVKVASDSHTVYFKVTDQGPGLADDDTAQAKRRFWRSGGQHGSGLGLTIADAVASRYGGRLVLSNLDVGFEARLELPRCRNIEDGFGA